MNSFVKTGEQVDSEAVYSIVASCLGVVREQLAVHTCFLEDLGVDSIDRLALAAELEEEFDVVISDKALNGMHTVGDAVLCIVAAIESREFECEP